MLTFAIAQFSWLAQILELFAGHGGAPENLPSQASLGPFLFPGLGTLMIGVTSLKRIIMLIDN